MQTNIFLKIDVSSSVAGAGFKYTRGAQIPPAAAFRLHLNRRPESCEAQIKNGVAPSA
jgi:hypothetical protein